MKNKDPLVLIVEDEESFNEMLSTFFNRWGWGVIAVKLSRQAVTLLDNDLQLIVLDLMLPDAPGTIVLEAVRQQRLNIPVAILTGKTLEDAQTMVAGLNPDRLFLKDHFLELKEYTEALFTRFHDE